MPKRPGSPDYPDAWAWLCDLAAAEGIKLERMPLTEAADCALSHLERKCAAGLPPAPGSVQLAALLVRLQGELALSGAASDDPILERAYACARARMLAARYAHSLQVWSRPEFPQAEPETEPEPALTLFDLISQCQTIVRARTRHHAAAPGR